MLCISFCPASISMYIDQMSHRLGWVSTMPSKSVFPLSGSPNLYSSWANLEMVLRSEKQTDGSLVYVVG